MPKAKIWQELLLAAIGEQLSLSVDGEDEICGVSVRIRYDGAVIQIWHQDTELKSKASVRHYTIVMRHNPTLS